MYRPARPYYFRAPAFCSISAPEREPSDGFAFGVAVLPLVSLLTPGCPCICFSERLPELGFAVGFAVEPAPLLPGRSFIAFVVKLLSSAANATEADKASAIAARIGFIIGTSPVQEG